MNKSAYNISTRVPFSYALKRIVVVIDGTIGLAVSQIASGHPILTSILDMSYNNAFGGDYL